jgi:hypothetical protein
MAVSEGLRSTAAAVEPQQVVAALSAAMTTAVTVPLTPPAPAPVTSLVLTCIQNVEFQKT